MLRAKLLNRSGWKRLTAFTSSIPAMVLMTVCCQSAIGNAQQGTGSASQVAQRTSAREAASSATTAISSTKTNQQPQHRVSVAPQGGELEKKTGASPFGIAVFGKDDRKLLSCKVFEDVDTVKECALAKDASLDEVMSVILKAHRENTEACERDKKYILDKIGEALNGKK